MISTDNYLYNVFIYLSPSLSLCVFYFLCILHIYYLPIYFFLILYRFSFGCKEAKLLCKNVENM